MHLAPAGMVVPEILVACLIFLDLHAAVAYTTASADDSGTQMVDSNSGNNGPVTEALPCRWRPALRLAARCLALARSSCRRFWEGIATTGADHCREAAIRCTVPRSLQEAATQSGSNQRYELRGFFTKHSRSEGCKRA